MSFRDDALDMLWEVPPVSSVYQQPNSLTLPAINNLLTDVLAYPKCMAALQMNAAPVRDRSSMAFQISTIIFEQGQIDLIAY